MSDQKKPSMNAAELQQQLEAKFRAEAERNEKALEALTKAYADVKAGMEHEVARYANDPVAKKTIDTMCGASGKNKVAQMYEVAVLKLQASPDYTGNPVTAAALDGLTKQKGIAADALANEDIAAVNAVLQDASTGFSRQAMVAEVLQIGAKLNPAASPSKPAGKPASKPSAPAPATGSAPAAVGDWSDDGAGHIAPPPVAAQDDLIPGLNFLNPASQVKDNATLEAEAKKLYRDARKIKGVVSEAITSTASGEYKSFKDEGNRKYLNQLFSAANRVEEAVKGLVGASSHGSKIAVDNTNRGDWQNLIDDETRKLNDALVKFEAAEFAVSKQRNRASARASVAREMRKTITEECTTPVTDKGAPLNLEALNEAISPPTLWQRHGKKIATSGAALLIMSMAGVGVSVMGGRNDAKNNAPEVANANPAPVDVRPPPKVERKAPEAVAPVAPPPEAPKEAPKDAPKDALPPAPEAPRMPAAPKPADDVKPVAPAEVKLVDMEKLNDAELRDFVQKNVIPHLQSQYGNDDGKNPVLSLFKDDKWKVEYPQTMEWHEEAAKARKDGKDIPHEHNGGMLFITSSKGDAVLPVVLGSTNANFSILNGNSYHTEWGDPLVLTLGGRKETNIGSKVLAPAVSVHNDVLIGAKVRMNEPHVRGTDMQSELRYTGVPLTRVPHVDSDLALRFVAPQPANKSRVSPPIVHPFSVMIGALDPEHEKFKDNGVEKRKTYTIVMEGMGALTSRIVYKEVGPHQAGEIAAYCKQAGIEIPQYDGFKVGFRYAGPVIPHQVDAADGSAAPAIIRVHPSSERLMKGSRGHLGTLYLNEVREVNVTSPEGITMKKQVPQPVEVALGGQEMPDMTGLMQLMAVNPEINDRYQQGHTSAIHSQLKQFEAMAFPLLPRPKRYRGEGVYSAEQFEFTGRNIGNVTVFSRNGGYDPTKGIGVTCVRVAAPGDAETLRQAIEAVEKHARDRINPQLGEPKAGPLPRRRNGNGLNGINGGMGNGMGALQRQLHDSHIRLDEHELRSVTELFAMGSPDVATALKGDARSAAAMLLTRLSQVYMKKDLAEALGPQQGPHDDEHNAMLKLVNAFREAVSEGKAASTGLTRTELADLRKPNADPSLPALG